MQFLIFCVEVILLQLVENLQGANGQTLEEPVHLLCLD